MPTLTFKTNVHEAQSIRRAAKAKRMTVSAYTRYMLLEAPRGKPEAKHVDRIKPGRAVVSTPPINREDLDAAIYDY